MNTNIVYYFSGTGNSLALAKTIVAQSDNTVLVPMASEPPLNEIGGKGFKIGFVFPVYYGKLPRRVNHFIQNLKINPDTYCFSVVTTGGPVASGALTILKETLAEKGVLLSYGKAIMMAGNYILEYNPADSKRTINLVKKAKAQLTSIISDISKSRQNNIRYIKFTANNLYKDIPSLDKQFYANERCTSCGQCQKICPVQNIILTKGKPEWQGHCEHCVACIHWCPTEAIQYGKKTLDRRRYHHPEITASELIGNCYRLHP